MNNSSSALTANKLKIMAIALMLLDHFVVIFLPAETFLYMALRVPTRIVAPVFCYLIAEGFFYTSNNERYIFRLLIFAFVSHIPFNLAFGYPLIPARLLQPETSVIWTLVMGLAALTALKSEKIRVDLKLIILAVCCIAAYEANWNYVAVLWIAAFGVFRGYIKRQILAFCVIGIVFHLTPVCLRFIRYDNASLHWYQIGIFLAIPFLVLYNGKLGKKSKVISWGFYVFYPAHLIVLYLLNRFTSLSEFFR